MSRLRDWRGRVLIVLILALGWSLPAQAAVLRIVQSGSVTMGAVVNNVPIASVNMAKTFVFCFSDQNNPTGSNPTYRQTCELTSATQLTITVSVANAAQTVSWYVVEFLSGVLVQRGLRALGAGVLTVAVPLAPWLYPTYRPLVPLTECIPPERLRPPIPLYPTYSGPFTMSVPATRL